VEQATIGRSLVIKGEISGAESLYIDGRVEGAILVPEKLDHHWPARQCRFRYQGPRSRDHWESEGEYSMR